MPSIRQRIRRVFAWKSRDYVLPNDGGGGDAGDGGGSGRRGAVANADGNRRTDVITTSAAAVVAAAAAASRPVNDAVDANDAHSETLKMGGMRKVWLSPQSTYTNRILCTVRGRLIKQFCEMMRAARQVTFHACVVRC